MVTGGVAFLNSGKIYLFCLLCYSDMETEIINALVSIISNRQLKTDVFSVGGRCVHDITVQTQPGVVAWLKAVGPWLF